jgi:capsule polysaccharide export protein KpsE/RkpR
MNRLIEIAIATALLGGLVAAAATQLADDLTVIEAQLDSIATTTDEQRELIDELLAEMEADTRSALED